MTNLLSQPSFCSLYSILKPNHFLATRKVFEAVPGTSYYLSTQHEPSIRRYKMVSVSLEADLKMNEWRCKNTTSIAHAYCLQLLPPDWHRQQQYEIFIEHLEVKLADMSKMILPESLYILLHSLTAVKQLLLKFQEVTINEQSIGLNSLGKCVLWLNSRLELNLCQERQEKLKNEGDIIDKMIHLILQKSEPACKQILLKILQQTKSLKGQTFELAKDLLLEVARINRVKIPQHLRYMVNQRKILTDLKNLQSKKKPKNMIRNKFKSFISDSKKPPSQTHQRQLTRKHSQGTFENSFQKTRLCTQNFLFELRRKSDLTETTKTLKPKYLKSSPSFLSTNKSWKDNSGKTLMRVMSNNEFESKQLAKCKSNLQECINIINNIKPSPSTRSINSPMISGFDSQKEYAFNFNMSFSKHSGQNISNILAQNREFKVCDSLIDSLPCKIVENIGPQESLDNSPVRGKNIKSIQSIESQTIIGSQRVEEVIKLNKWKKTVDGLLYVKPAMNTSIIEGLDISDYLQDVQLDKLDQLHRQMAVSQVPVEVQGESQ